MTNMGYPVTKDEPIMIRCPNCTNVGKTRIEYILNKKEALTAALIMAPFCLFWWPFYSTDYKVAIHYCSTCNAYIGHCK